MEYAVRNLTMRIDTTDGDHAGDCMGYIPFAHKSFLKDCCGVERNENWKAGGWEPLYEHQYGEIGINAELGHYFTSSPDLLIAYMSWLMEQDGPQVIDIEYAKPFWAIHDAQHAINDESGCSIYVDANIELERLHEAFKLMIDNGPRPDAELIQEVNEAYTGRFGIAVDFADEYLTPYQTYRADYTCPDCGHEWETESEEEAYYGGCMECGEEDIEPNSSELVELPLTQQTELV